VKLELLGVQTLSSSYSKLLEEYHSIPWNSKSSPRLNSQDKSSDKERTTIRSQLLQTYDLTYVDCEISTSGIARSETNIYERKKTISPKRASLNAPPKRDRHITPSGATRTSKKIDKI
jgi:hypothetical protein